MGSENNRSIDPPATTSPVAERPVSQAPVGEVLVEAIAELEGTEPDQLEFQLENYLDDDALQGLLEHSAAEMQIRIRLGPYIALVTTGSVRCHRA